MEEDEELTRIRSRMLRDMFWPPPKVDSMIVRLRQRKPPFFVEDEGVFFEVVRVLFSQRNKKLKNAVMPFFGKFGIPKRKALGLVDTLPFHQRRPRELSPEEIGLVADKMVKSMRELSLL